MAEALYRTYKYGKTDWKTLNILHIIGRWLPLAWSLQFLCPNKNYGKLRTFSDLGGGKFRLFIGLLGKRRKETTELINIWIPIIDKKIFNFNFEEKYCKKPRPKILRLFSLNCIFFIRFWFTKAHFVYFENSWGLTVGKMKKFLNPAKLQLIVVNFFISAIKI